MPLPGFLHRFFGIVLLLTLLFSGCSKPPKNTLALVGNRPILSGDFVSRMESIRKKIELPDNGQVRTQVLQTMIDEEILIGEADRRGFRRDSEGRQEEKRLEIQELLDTFLQKRIVAGVTVSETDLKDAFSRLHTRIKARHLYADSRRRADSLYAEVMNGETFEKLASEIFQDPRLRDMGGSLGTFTADEMDPAFEDEAFRLGIGQVSRPVRTAQGYSIIRVDSRIADPLLTETEFAKTRGKLEGYCLYRKQRKLSQAVVDSLRQALNISFNEPLVAELLRTLQNQIPQTRQENGFSLPDTGQFQDQILVRSKIGEWNIRTFGEQARFTSDEQRQWIRNMETAEDFIAGLVVRTSMLSEAKRSNLHKTPSFKINTRRNMDDFLLKRMEEALSDENPVPEDTLRSFFEKNGIRFRIPAKIRLKEIVLDNESQTLRIKYQLENHAPFETLARTHSVRRESAENGGDIGMFTREELGQYADRIFPLRDGQWTGPIRMEGRYAFFQCVGHEPQRDPSFDEIRPEIEKTLSPFWEKTAKQEWLKRARQDVKIVTHPELLHSIRFDEPDEK